MFSRVVAAAAASLLLFMGAASAQAGERALSVRGSGTATAPLAEVASKLKQQGIELKIDNESNTSIAIESVANGSIDLGVTTRAISPEERAAHISSHMQEEVVGVQLLALVVSADVWGGGVRSLDKEQMRKIYEREITNWRELGGPDHAIKFFTPEEGHGVWELLVTWLYGDVRKAPLPAGFEVVRGGEDTRNTVEFNAGSLSVVAPLWVDNKHTFALSLKSGNELIPATLRGMREQKYPLARSLYLVTADRPTGDLRKVVDFMHGAEGHAALKKFDYTPPETAP
jgi:phosphate transport system substrate-binding protein